MIKSTLFAALAVSMIAFTPQVTSSAIAAPSLEGAQPAERASGIINVQQRGMGGGGSRAGAMNRGGGGFGNFNRGGGGGLGNLNRGGGGGLGNLNRGGGGIGNLNRGGRGLANRGNRGWQPGKWAGNKWRGNRRNRYFGYGFYPGAAVYGYSSYGNSCSWLRRKAVRTGSSYWWRRYEDCRYGY